MNDWFTVFSLKFVELQFVNVLSANKVFTLCPVDLLYYRPTCQIITETSQVTKGQSYFPRGPLVGQPESYNAPTNSALLTKQWQTFDKRWSCNWRVDREVITDLACCEATWSISGVEELGTFFTFYSNITLMFVCYLFLVCLTTPSVADAAGYEIERREDQ